MAIRRKKSKEELTSGDLSKEFFGDGSVITPGQDKQDDGTVGLAQAILDSKGGQQQADTYSLFDEKKAPVDFGPDYNKKSWFNFGGGENPEVNPYAAEQDKRYSLDPRTSKLIRVIILALVLLVLGILLPSSSYNTEYNLSIQSALACIQTNAADLLALITGHGTGSMVYKLSAYLVACFAGLALATTGAVYQGALKNALVSPTTLGISSGATVGVAIFALLAPASLLSPIFSSTTGAISMASVIDYYDSLSFGEYLLVTEGKAFASILGCFVVVLLVLLVSHFIGKGKSSSFGLIICGQVVALVASSVVEMIRYYVVEVLDSDIRSSAISGMQGGMTAGSLYTPMDVLFIGIPVVVCFVVVLILRNRMNLLSFNDEEARSMGISTETLRWIMVGVCTLMTAVVLSFSGQTAFIGFAVPLIARRYVGPSFSHLIPVSAALGCLFMIFTYWFTDLDLLLILFHIDLPISVNVITSIVGAIMFAFVALKQRKENRSADWL